MSEPEEFVDFGLWVRRRREQILLTQAELGGQIGYAADSIRAIEAGRRKPSMEMAERLADALGIEPQYREGFRHRALGGAAARSIPPDPQAVAASGPVRHRLPPIALPDLVGRDDTLAALQQRLGSSGVRLLTLLGPPGVGKTRLARALGLAAQEVLPDGACWVTLTSIRSVDRLVAVIAYALHLTLTPERPPQRVLIDYLRRRDLLLVLDNVELLRAEAADLAGLLNEIVAEAPKLRLLITSQVALQLGIEHVATINPLQTVPADASADVISDNPAVQLFVQRAQAVDDSFALTPASAAAVTALCRALDGLPLAIELAAARCRFFSPEALLERMGQRLNLLQHQSVDRDRRHHSLRTALEWSTSLLSDQERALLSGLSVFRDGFTLEAAECVCSRGASAAAMLHDVEQLVNHSLIWRSSPPGMSPRFALLESIRVFASGGLTSKEQAALRQSHAAFFLSYLRRAAPFWGQESVVWVEDVGREDDNINAALAHSTQDGDAAALVELVIGLTPYWIAQGLIAEGRYWAGIALGQRRVIPVSAVARLLVVAADLAYQQSDYVAAQQLASEALLVAEGTGQSADAVRAHYRLAWVATRQAAYQRSLAHLDDAASLARQAADLRGEAMCLGAMGWIARDHGDTAQALAAQQRSLMLYRQLGDTLSIAYTLNALGSFARDQGELEEAERLHTESLHLYEDAGHSSGEALALNGLGWDAGMWGDVERARGFLMKSLRLRDALGDDRARAWALSDLGWLSCEAEEFAQALQFYEQALGLYQSLGDRRGMAQTDVSIAYAASAIGERQTAHHKLAGACAALIDLKDRRSLARALEVGAKLALRDVGPQRAAELLGAAEGLRCAIGAVLPASERRWHSALVSAVRSDPDPKVAAAWANGRSRPLSEVMTGLAPAYVIIGQDL